MMVHIALRSSIEAPNKTHVAMTLPRAAWRIVLFCIVSPTIIIVSNPTMYNSASSRSSERSSTMIQMQRKKPSQTFWYSSKNVAQ